MKFVARVMRWLGGAKPPVPKAERRYCEDCRWLRGTPEFACFATCAHPKTPSLSAQRVFRIADRPSASVARSDTGRCGPAGRYWEAKPVNLEGRSTTR